MSDPQQTSQDGDALADAPELVPIPRLFARHAALRPGAPALTFEGETLDWRELDRRSNRLARALAAAGVNEGDFLSIALPNGIDFMLAAIAAWKLGAVPQPVSARMPEAEIVAIVELANPPVVLFDGALALERPVRRVADLLASEADDSALPEKVSPSWKAPTSGGSTGRPKLIVSGQEGVFDPASAELWRIGTDSTCLMPGPMYHNGPFITAFVALFTGAHLVLMPRFDAERTMALIDSHRATWVYMVPTMMHRIWSLPAEVKARYDISSLQALWHLAAPCPRWLKEKWIDWLGADVIWELYGGTEGQAATVISGSEWLERPGSVGKPALGEMCVQDENGALLPAGEIGEIFMRREAGLPPTYRYIGAEAKARGDWETIGDFGWIDEEGYVFLADRRSDLILVGGANVYPAEVEAAIDAFPGVQSSAVIGLPDDDLGARVHAIVQPRGSLDEAALAAHLEQRLARYKQPRSFEFVSEPLRDDAGKVRRSQLRAERLPAG